MNTSPHALAYIRSKEKLALVAYDDGGGVLTIGWGKTGGVTAGQTCTVEQAAAWFREDVAVAEAAVSKAITAPLSQGMFDALVSGEFNTGWMTLENGELSMLARLVNAGQPYQAAREMVKWCNDGGHGVRGLLIRRLEEALMFAGEKFPA